MTSISKTSWFAGAALVLVACGEDLTVTPVRNLERPSDMDFVCMAVVTAPDGKQYVSGQPMTQCYLDRPTVRKDEKGEEVKDQNGVVVIDQAGTPLGGPRAAFGLFTNTARAEVGAINLVHPDFGGDRLVDLDRLQPGFNMVPVGTLPERLMSSDDGCKSVTANRGSCDLSVIDNSMLLASQFERPASTSLHDADAGAPVETVRRLPILTADGRPLAAIPGDVAIIPRGKTMPPPVLPPATPDAGAPDAGVDAPVGDAGADAADAALPDAAAAEAGTGARQVTTVNFCGPDPAGAPGLHQAVVSFPGCDLVALVDLASGRIISSLRMRSDGTLEDAGPNPTCPGECVGGSPPPDAASAGPDGGASGPGSIGVSALALEPETGLVYVGAHRSPVIAVVEASATALRARADLKLQLAENPGGVIRLRLARDPFRAVRESTPPPPGTRDRYFVSPYGDFLYAFAQDGSVRVVLLRDVSGSTAKRHECDVNAQVARNDLSLGCIEIGTRPRNLLARGPGLRPPVVPPVGDPAVGPALPIDISFAHAGSVTSPTGFLLASNGIVYQIGLGSWLMEQTVERPHVVRSDGLAGTASAASTPSRSFSDSTVAFPTRVVFNTNDTGPHLQSYLAMGNRTEYLFFPSPAEVPATRTGAGAVIRWEGVLPLTTRQSGALSETRELPGAIAALTDEGASYCSSGVEKGDVLAMVGCEEDRQCDLERNQVCYRAAPGAVGVCLSRTLANDDAWTRRCQAELGSRRRYEVLDVSRTRVVLGLKPDEVPRPSIARCNPQMPEDPVCRPDSAHAPEPTRSGDPGFQCLELVAGEPRCLKPCGVKDPSGRWQPNDELCRSGHVCADVGNERVGPICVEGPPPRAECTPEEAVYQIQAGKAYLVGSANLPFFSRMREDPQQGGRCVPDPTRPPQLISRIPLAAPPCTSVNDGADAKGVLGGALFDPANEDRDHMPCLFRPEEPANSVSAVLQNPHFRLVLNNVDAYVGDAAGIFATIDSGFRPVTVSQSRAGDSPAMGVRVLTGPMKARTREMELKPPPPFVFVVDQSRTTSLLSRGKIMRINPYPYLYPPGGHFDSLLTGSLFPIQ